ncbi:MAG: ABC transporter ATP-binding protein [Planctomycetaceae bacterium]|nr:ABC transporter ATP-binding protein [Planctomycetaceae bacterium]
MIDFQNVTKLYGKVIGVNDVALSLQPGAYGLLGPNGSGKSTLINLIMGQLKPTIGSVHVFGECPESNDELYQQLGYCPSSEGMYSSVTGFKWVRYLLRLQGMNRRHATAAAEQALELVGMTNAMNRPISGYSRGMRQRTKMAQAISHDPKLLILDEPFNGLDPIGRHEMTVALQNWIESGKSLLLASHVLHEVESVTQSFLLICGGRLLASGHAHEVNQLLVDLPNDLTIRCSAPKRLAEAIVARDMADSLKIETDQLIASTRHPSRILAELPTWVTHDQIEIYEIRSADESLQELFNSLLKIHRGEI